MQSWHWAWKNWRRYRSNDCLLKGIWGGRMWTKINLWVHMDKSYPWCHLGWHSIFRNRVATCSDWYRLHWGHRLSWIADIWCCLDDYLSKWNRSSFLNHGCVNLNSCILETILWCRSSRWTLICWGHFRAYTKTCFHFTNFRFNWRKSLDSHCSWSHSFFSIRYCWLDRRINLWQGYNWDIWSCIMQNQSWRDDINPTLNQTRLKHLWLCQLWYISMPIRTVSKFSFPSSDWGF